MFYVLSDMKRKYQILPLFIILDWFFVSDKLKLVTDFKYSLEKKYIFGTK